MSVRGALRPSLLVAALLIMGGAPFVTAAGDGLTQCMEVICPLSYDNCVLNGGQVTTLCSYEWATGICHPYTCKLPGDQ